MCAPAATTIGTPTAGRASRTGGGASSASVSPGAPAVERDTASQFFPEKPRIGDKTIDFMMEDFLKAWLIDRDAVQAMGYVSERSYACLMEEGDDPLSFDRGTAPFLMYRNLKAASEALGQRTSLDDLTVGVRLNVRGLKVVTQKHHPQFVIYVVPDDIAARFDCESRLSLADPRRASRQYGNYFGATFYINGPGGQGYSLALLWAKRRRVLEDRVVAGGAGR